MPSATILILETVLFIAVVPLVLACLYLSKDSFSGLLIEPSFRLRKLLQICIYPLIAVEKKEILQIESHHSQLNNELFRCRELLIKSNDREEKLAESLRQATRLATRCEDKASEKLASERLQLEARVQRKQVAQLSVALEKQRRETVLLCEKLRQMEEGIRQAYVQKQGRIAELNSKKYIDRANAVIAKSRKINTEQVLRILERRVAQSEQDCLKLPPVETGLLETVAKLVEERESKAVQGMSATLENLTAQLSGEFLARLDLRQLKQNLRIVQLAAINLTDVVQFSLDAEQSIQECMLQALNEAATWNSRAISASAQGKEDRAEQSRLIEKGCLVSAIELEEEYERARESTMRLQQTISDLEAFEENISNRIAELMADEGTPRGESKEA